MRPLTFYQLVLVSFVCFFLFVDSKHIKRKTQDIKVILFGSKKKKTEKIGLEPITFGFGNHCSTN